MQCIFKCLVLSVKIIANPNKYDHNNGKKQNKETK